MGCSCIYRSPAEEFVQLQYAIRTAGKEHTCAACGAKISKGEKFRINQGWWWEYGPTKIITHATCLGCDQLGEFFFCDGWSYCSLLQDIADHFNDTEPPPDLCCLDGLPPEAAEGME